MTHEEYKNVFERYRMFVFYFCKKLIYRQDDAEDTTTKVFLSLWKYVKDVEVGNAKAFLLVTAKRKCLDLVKARKINASFMCNYVEVSEIKDSLEDIVEEIEVEESVIRRIYNAVNTLNDQERKIFKMKYFHDMSSAEIAKVLKLRPQTVYNTIQHALKHLRARLEVCLFYFFI